MVFSIGGYSELLLPRILLHVVLLLLYVRRFIPWAFNMLGLDDLFDPASGQNHHHPEFRSVSAMMVDEVLPVLQYEDLIVGGGQAATGGCTVCLYEVEGSDEVRWLSNCRHVFHRRCLDQWMEQDQRTCPICRAPLFSEEEMMHDEYFNDCIWAAAGIPDSFVTAAGEYSSFFSFPSS